MKGLLDDLDGLSGNMEDRLLSQFATWSIPNYLVRGWEGGSSTKVYYYYFLTVWSKHD